VQVALLDQGAEENGGADYPHLMNLPSLMCETFRSESFRTLTYLNHCEADNAGEHRHRQHGHRGGQANL